MPEVILCSDGSGYCRVVLGLLKLLGYSVPFILDDRVAGASSQVNLIPVRGPLNLLPDREDTFAFLAIADDAEREQAAERFQNVRWVTVVHPRAWVDPSANIGAGSYISAGVVVNAEAVVGRHVIVDSGSSIGHDCVVEDFVSLEPGVRLGGGARIGRVARCAIGSAVIPNCSVGTRAFLGPRAVAVKSVPAGSTFEGVPARPLLLTEPSRKNSVAEERWEFGSEFHWIWGGPNRAAIDHS